MKDTSKRRNPLAQVVRTMGRRVVKDKTKYTRKEKHKKNF